MHDGTAIDWADHGPINSSIYRSMGQTGQLVPVTVAQSLPSVTLGLVLQICHES